MAIGYLSEHSTAESHLCGSMIIEEKAIDIAMSLIEPEDFESDIYRDVFLALTETRKTMKQFDLIAAIDKFIKKGHNPKKARILFRDLMEAVGTSTQVKTYANMVIDQANKRMLEKMCRETALNPYMSGEEVTDTLLTGIEKLRKITHEADLVEPMEISTSIVKSLSEEKRNFSIPTGFKNLDEKLGGGIMNGNLVILAGRPGMGKTTFGLALADNILSGFEENDKLLFVSLEMSPEEIFAKRASKICNVPAIDILISDDLNEKQTWDITMAMHELSKKKFMMNKTSPMTVAEIGEIVEMDKDIKCVFIDHVGLIAPSRAVRGKNTNEIVSDITKNLKQLAKNKKIPIIALCQLSRKVEERGDKHPVMSDLRDSGSIEQDADVVMLLYRDDYYSGVTRKYWEPSELELILGKSRFGSTGSLKFDVYFGSETISEKQ